MVILIVKLAGPYFKILQKLKSNIGILINYKGGQIIYAIAWLKLSNNVLSKNLLLERCLDL